MAGRWEHGIDIGWVGKRVERLSGQDLGTYPRERIIGPLGVRRDPALKLGPSWRERLVAMHARGPDGARILKPRPWR